MATFLQSFELPKAILLEPKPFSVDNDLLTPTFELRRKVGAGWAQGVNLYVGHISTWTYERKLCGWQSPELTFELAAVVGPSEFISLLS